MDRTTPGGRVFGFVLVACEPPPASSAPVGTVGLAEIAVRLTSDRGVYQMSGTDLDGDGAEDLALASWSALDLVVQPLRSGRLEDHGYRLDVGAEWIAGLDDTDGDGRGEVAFGENFEADWIGRAATPVAGWISGADRTRVAGWVYDPDQTAKNLNHTLDYTVAGPGDTNGDGRADLVVAMDAVWLFHGPPSDGVEVGDADLIVTAGLLQSTSLVAGGDWDGDGARDVAIADLHPPSPEPVVYLLDATRTGSVPLEEASYASIVTQWGWAASGAGDLDGDGADDLVVLAENTATIAWGPVSGALEAASATDGVAGDGADVIESIAIAGDLDADGFADLVLGAPGPEDQPGSAAVVYGPIHGRVDYDDADARLIGEAVGSGAGAVVAPLDDVDGDGYADFGVVGELNRDGLIYVVFGGAR